MYKDMLPIGSVVLLKGGNKQIMVIGRIQTKAGEDRIYDYSACYYPEGMIGGDNVFFFDREAIEEVCFRGFENENELSFRENVLDKLGELEVRDGQIVPKE